MISIAESNGVNTEAFLEKIKSGWAVGEEFYQVHIVPKADRLENVRPPIPDRPSIRESMRKTSVKPVSEAQSKPKGKPLKIGKRGEKSSRLGLPGMGREGYFHYPLKQGNKNIGDVILRVYNDFLPIFLKIFKIKGFHPRFLLISQ